MAFQDLPSELLQPIVDLLGPDELDSFMLCCRRFYVHCEHLLPQHRSMKRKYGSVDFIAYSTFERERALILAIIEEPRVAQYVKRIHFARQRRYFGDIWAAHACSPLMACSTAYAPANTPALMPHLTPADADHLHRMFKNLATCSSLSFLQSEVVSMGLFPPSLPNFVEDTLLLLCPNLEVLESDFDTPRFVHSRYHRLFWDRTSALASEKDDDIVRHPLGRLRTLIKNGPNTHYDGAPRDDMSHREVYNLNLASLDGLPFYLSAAAKSLRSLYVRGAVTGVSMWKFMTWIPQQSLQPIMIEEIQLYRSRIDGKEAKALLTELGKVNEFHYSHRYLDSGNINSVSRIIGATVGYQMKKLSLLSSGHGDLQHSGPLIAHFWAFVCLEELRIFADWLQPGALATLPLSLQYVGIQVYIDDPDDKGWLLHRSRGMVEDFADAINERYLSVRHMALSTIPKVISTSVRSELGVSVSKVLAAVANQQFAFQLDHTLDFLWWTELPHPGFS